MEPNLSNTTLTMKDIAKALGVSVATVSRALKDSPSISRERRKEIQDYAREHNYMPNVVAEQLRNSRNAPLKVIGVIVPEFMHYYFASVLTGIEQEASARGYRIFVASSYEQSEREANICDAYYRNKVCGIIVSQAKNTTNYDHFRRLYAEGLPLVFYDRICPAINAHRVVVDDYQGTRKAVLHLIECGSRRIAYYGTSTNMEIGINRLNGYKDALSESGIAFDPELVKLCDNRSDAEMITPHMLELENRPDSFFAVNDETAIGILHVVKNMGLRVPEEIQICGFTGGPEALVSDPPLTSVEQDGIHVGQQAADILIKLVEGELPRNHAEKRLVKTHLVVRGTTR